MRFALKVHGATPCGTDFGNRAFTRIYAYCIASNLQKKRCVFFNLADGSHYRQRIVILRCYLRFAGLANTGLYGARHPIYEEKTMRDQKMEMNPPLADRVGRSAGPIEIEQTIAAMIATTRQQWAARESAFPSTAVTFVNRSRLIRPNCRLVAGARDYAS